MLGYFRKPWYANLQRPPEVACRHPRFMLLQWHITERCNNRCAHCYQEENEGGELTFEELLAVLEQYKDLLDDFAKEAEAPSRGHINVTGGEPFIRSDFPDFLATK